MHLFRTVNSHKLSESVVPKIQTPFGQLITNIQWRQENIQEFAVNTRLLKNDSYIILYETRDITAELLVTKPEPNLPDGATIDDCRSLMWRCQAKKSLEQILFTLKWEIPFNWTQSAPDSGENLDAISFYDDSYVLTVGTEDGETLVRRAKQNHWMAKSIADLEAFHLIRYLEDGLQVEIPRIQVGEQLQIHFNVAWGESTDYNVGPWFAVDMLPEQIMAKSGVIE
ncbi:hypothetical protein BK131_10240 [Paenibacillus amylolyticus]|uniref:Uncharacterized protein n=1 Tax=Paenibacillus amylolyticus TaxID=1451 RepID=A0A1R1BZN0_PAEAM|nr:hypothetical protein [Paenibacillus amylolyticus]OMF15257.1 hypothetical protein BK131_10240 [Paenibacillus amylolyticus]